MTCWPWPALPQLESNTEPCERDKKNGGNRAGIKLTPPLTRDSALAPNAIFAPESS